MLTPLALLAVAASPIQEPASVPTEKEIRAAIEHMGEDDLAEAAEWYRFECTQIGTESRNAIVSALALLEVDPGFLDVDSPPPFYDPGEHTPGQGARRHVLDPHSSRVRRQRAEFGLVPVPGAPIVAYRYDWASGEIRRRASPLRPNELFENALAGYLPDYGLARAILLARLDDGSLRKEMAGFGHAYADRAGNVFPGITLFDAWASGKTIEMPDVDTLGLVHDLLGDWKRWTAPVPPAQHDELYATLGELFVPVRRARALRETAADLYLTADPIPPGLYLPAADVIGAAWVEVEYKPTALAKELPAPDEINAWIAARRGAARDHDAARLDFEARRALLRREASWPRALLVKVLRGLGAMKEQ